MQAASAVSDTIPHASERHCPNTTIVVETQTRLRSEKLAYTNREREDGDSLVGVKTRLNMTLGATGGVHHGRSQGIGAQRVQS